MAESLPNGQAKSGRHFSWRGAARAQIANMLSGSRLLLAAFWIVTFDSAGSHRREILRLIASAAALSDFLDGRIARRLGQTNGSGRWLDPLADIVFLLTALSTESIAGAIPIYIPVLIACSFAQYVIDSIAVSRSSTPVRSRLGHWGGIVNFALVLILAWTPPPLLPARLVRQASPLIALFYVAAMVERMHSYKAS